MKPQTVTRIKWEKQEWGLQGVPGHQVPELLRFSHAGMSVF